MVRVKVVAPFTWFIGSSDNERINGSAKRDKIWGYGGDDFLFGYSNHDKIYGGAGHDYIDGGAGNDWLSGASGNDIIYGGVGNDSIDGGSGDDALDGGKGNDAISGGAGNDVLKGQAGVDVLHGGAGNDRLYGGSGRDILFGGNGQDTLYGGSGADVFVISVPRAASSASAGNLAINKDARLTSTDVSFGQSAPGLLPSGSRVVITDHRPANLDIIADFQKGDKIDLTAMSWVSDTDGLSYRSISLYLPNGHGGIAIEPGIRVFYEGTALVDVRASSLSTSDFIL